MAQFTHNIKSVWSAGGLTLSKTVSQTADAEDNRSVSVPAATTDKLIDFAMTIARLKMIYILADQDMTLETNSGSSPGNTITLKANIPFWWSSTSGESNPFTSNITALYATHAGATDGTLEIRALYDSTA